MNWYKIRRYILVLLVLINGMLIVSIVRHNNNTSIDNPYFSRKNMNNLEQLLEERGVGLLGELPRDLHIVGPVRTQFMPFHKDNQPQLFADFAQLRTLDNSKRMQLYIEGSTQHIGEESFHLEKESEQKAFAEAFLARYFAHNTFLCTQEQAMRLEYKPLNEGFVLEESAISFVFDRYGVSISGTDLWVLERSQTRIQSISSAEAVLAALPDLSSGERIERIELVYHFELPEGDLYKVNDVRSFPCWKITTTGGRDLYILAM